MTWELNTESLDHDGDELLDAELELMLIELGAALPPEFYPENGHRPEDGSEA
jgi:hypothetical protein